MAWNFLLSGTCLATIGLQVTLGSEPDAQNSVSAKADNITTFKSMTSSPQLTKIVARGHATAGSKLSPFARLANEVAHITGRPTTFIVCLAVIVIWGISGPFFRYSDTWQLIINTGTTIVTFLMVFLIQNTQNREGIALQAKLDELIRVTRQARHDLVAAEQLPEEEVVEIKEEVERLSRQDP